MKKPWSKFAVLFLFGTFAATSGAFASTDDGVDLAENVDDQRVEPLGISEEERTRREEECYTVYLACCDWCKRTKGGGYCYNECMKKQADCLARIPDHDE